VHAYLALHHNARVVFDPTYPTVDMEVFIKTDWKSMYGDVKEVVPSLSILITGFVIYLNMAPLMWFSKRHPTVESSVFGAEFAAIKNGITTWRGIRYKLRMMGVTLGGPTYVYGDSMSVVTTPIVLSLF
jgi:hypothetical protein